MSKQQEATENVFRLPKSIVGGVELSRALRELEAIDDFLYQTNLRAPGTNVTPPRTTKTLNDLAEMNRLSLLDPAQRKSLLEILAQIRDQAPIIHVSFAVEPSNNAMEKIVAWFRVNIHPYTMVNVGLQPTLAVGCIMRTTNHYFDMSLRNRFFNSRSVLISKLEERDAE